jgi:ATP-dependent DNA helicase RecG
MDVDELRALLDALRAIGTDTQDVEVKTATDRLPQRLWQTISAFANTRGGGTIILGVSEEMAFEIVGVRDAGKLEADVASLCSEMEPPVRADIRTLTLDGKHLVVATIPELLPQEKPCFYRPSGMNTGSYVRVADGDRRLTAYELQLLLSSRSQPRNDGDPVTSASIDDLDDALVGGLLQRLRANQPRVFAGIADDEALRRLNAATIDDGKLVPTLGGLLALGRYPQQFFPQLNATFVVYPHIQAGEPGPSGERFLDNETIDGPIAEIVHRAFLAVQRNMKRRSVVVGMGRREIWEYPEIALREAIVNSLVHRDLSASARGTAVQIEMYPDRIEIRNPGGLYGPISVDDLLEEGVALSSSRNQILLRLLEDTPLGSEGTVCENRGSGIAAMVRALKQAGMSLPLLRDRIAQFQVTFPNATLLDEETVRWLESLGQDGLTETQTVGLAQMRKGEQLSNSTYRAASLMDSRVAGQELRDLVERGLVEQIGTRGGARYRLADSPRRGAGAASKARRSADSRLHELREALATGEKSRQELEAITGLQPAGVLRYLRQLKNSGEVEQTGATRSPKSKWRLVNRAPSLF